jgi:glucose-6-phosphate 1-dehydrogenase
MAFRFANFMFEPVWNRNYIDHIQITAAEDIGIGSRAGYYDNAGALRDLVQNHMLQLLTLVCMEPPASFEADKVRDEKVKVLQAITPPTPEEVKRDTVRAQYTAGFEGGEEAGGYKEEDGVPDDSRTGDLRGAAPGGAQLALGGRADLPAHRQAAGPQGDRDRVQLKPVPHLAFQSQGRSGCSPTSSCLTVQPNEGVSLSLGAKIPGSSMRIRPVNMEFLYGSAFMSQSPEAYERLILDAMRGDATLFTRSDEVIAQWSIIDPILKAWKEDDSEPVHTYASGSTGPEAATSSSRHASGEDCNGRRLARARHDARGDRGGAAPACSPSATRRSARTSRARDEHGGDRRQGLAARSRTGLQPGRGASTRRG